MKFKPKGKTKLMSVILAAAMLLSAVPSGLILPALASDTPDVSVAVFTDIGYMTPEEQGVDSEDFDAFRRNSDTLYEYMEGILDSALASVKDKALKGELRYLIVNGSLTATGSEKSHLALAAKLKELEDSTGGALQVIAMAGEGDINASSFSFESGVKESVPGITPSRFKEIYADLGYDLALADGLYDAAVSKAGGLTYTVSLNGDIRLIMADVSKYSPDITSTGTAAAEKGGVIAPELLDYIKAQALDAKENGQVPVLVSDFAVVPVNHVIESLNSSDFVRNYHKIAEELADAGIHFHIGGKPGYNDIASIVSDEGETIYGILSSALTSFPATYRIIGLTKGEGQTLSACAELVDCDDVQPVVYKGNNVQKPFKKTTALNASFGGSSQAYVEKFIRNLADDFLDKVKAAGGFIKYYEDIKGINIRFMVDSLFFGGISIDGTPVLSGQNVESFLNAIDNQLMKRYLNDRSYTYELVKKVSSRIAGLPASNLPCDKFYYDYLIGSPYRAGTFGDALVSVMLYMTLGNEDKSDDDFINDVINNLYNTSLSKDVYRIALEVLFDDIIKDALKHTKIDISSYFEGEAKKIANYIQLGFEFLMFLIRGDNSYFNLLEIILKNSNTKYGESFEDLKNYIINDSIAKEDFEIVGISAAELIDAAVTDSNPDEKSDHGVCFSYNGKVKVVPTKEELRLPSMKAVTFGENTQTSVNISWYTKLSVTGTDIEIYPANGNNPPMFTGTPTTGAGIRKFTQVVKRSYPAGSFGIFDFGSSEVETRRHVIQLTGLEKGKKYFYRVGDASRGWWSEIGSFTTGAGEGNFTFLYMSESGGKTKAQYEIFANTVKEALKAYPKTSFIMHAGSLTANGANTRHWQWALDTPAELSQTILMPAAGRLDARGINSMLNTFDLPLPDLYQESSSTGLYYSFDYNNVHFAVLNTNDQKADGTLSDAQIKWLKEDLEETNKPWKIVMMNKSPYSSGPHIGDPETIALRNQIGDLLYKYRVDLVLQGNDGVYMRSQPIRANRDAGSDAHIITNSEGKMYTSVLNPMGTIYLNSGPAGARGNTTVPDSETIQYIPRGVKSYSGSKPMFTAITVEGDNLFIDAYTVEGDELTSIDRIAIERGTKEFPMGDVNLDGKVNAKDARALLRHYAILEIITDSKAMMAADVNGDGKINAADARLILRKGAKLEEFKKQTVSVPVKELWK